MPWNREGSSDAEWHSHHVGLRQGAAREKVAVRAEGKGRERTISCSPSRTRSAQAAWSLRA